MPVLQVQVHRSVVVLHTAGPHPLAVWVPDAEQQSLKPFPMSFDAQNEFVQDAPHGTHKPRLQHPGSPRLVAQTLPHVPQLFGSVATSTHEVPHTFGITALGLHGATHAP